jgi:hypothetical protein
MVDLVMFVPLDEPQLKQTSPGVLEFWAAAGATVVKTSEVVNAVISRKINICIFIKSKTRYGRI